MKIALIKYDHEQSALLGQVIASAGHECIAFENAACLGQALRESSFDMFILDGPLPERDVDGLVRRVRHEAGPRAPILCLTCPVSEACIVATLAAGADAMMVKPIRCAELAARMEALLRRAYPAGRAADGTLAEHGGR